jgi:5-methylcytosine-specific restriction endonuclease McrA
LDRDGGLCQLCGRFGADEVDHVVPVAKGGSDDLTNLRSVHHVCHLRKSSAEGNAARWAVRRTRPPERHPGLICDD